MIVQLDTNVLTRLAQSSHPLNGTALAAISIIESNGHTCGIVPQNLFEFWAVATRPVSSNGLGLAVTEAKQDFSRFSHLTLLDPVAIAANPALKIP